MGYVVYECYITQSKIYIFGFCSTYYFNDCGRRAASRIISGTVCILSVSSDSLFGGRTIVHFPVIRAHFNCALRVSIIIIYDNIVMIYNNNIHFQDANL